jgi:hypothetical protein
MYVIPCQTVMWINYLGIWELSQKWGLLYRSGIYPNIFTTWLQAMKRRKHCCSCKQILKISGSNLTCRARFNCVRFEVFMTVTMKNTIFWMLCHTVWVEVYWHFRVTCCFHIQGQRGSPGSKQEASRLTLQFWNGSNTFLWNADKLLQDYMASHPRRQLS